MKYKLENCPTFLFLLVSGVMTSCGGGGDINISTAPVNTAPVVSFPPVSNTDFEEMESFSAVVPVVNQMLLKLTGKNGEITVSGLPDATSVIIAAVKRVQSDSAQDAEAALRELTVKVQDLANEVRVETIQPSDTGGRNYIVDYAITMPKFLKINVNNLNGIVKLDSIDNDITVMNLNGNVTSKKILGSASIDLLNGKIEGEITLPLNGIIDLETLTGGIDLAIPANTSAEFSAAVSSGSISLSNLVLQNEVRTSTTLRGTLGSGQGMITLRTKQLGNIGVSAL